MRTQQKMIETKDGDHMVTISSDKPKLNEIPPKPRPSRLLGKDSEVYYTDPKSGKITHQWEINKNLPGGGYWRKL